MRAQIVRRTSAALAGLALAVGGFGVAGSLQADAATTATHRPVVHKPVVVKRITIKANKKTAKEGTRIILSGKASGFRKGTQLHVQRLEKGKWVTVRFVTKVGSHGTYSVAVRSRHVGLNKFRVVAHKTHSAAVSVTIIK